MMRAFGIPFTLFLFGNGSVVNMGVSVVSAFNKQPFQPSGSTATSSGSSASSFVKALQLSAEKDNTMDSYNDAMKRFQVMKPDTHNHQLGPEHASSSSAQQQQQHHNHHHHQYQQEDSTMSAYLMAMSALSLGKNSKPLPVQDVQVVVVVDDANNPPTGKTMNEQLHQARETYFEEMDQVMEKLQQEKKQTNSDINEPAITALPQEEESPVIMWGTPTIIPKEPAIRDALWIVRLFVSPYFWSGGETENTKVNHDVTDPQPVDPMFDAAIIIEPQIHISPFVSMMDEAETATTIEPQISMSPFAITTTEPPITMSPFVDIWPQTITIDEQPAETVDSNLNAQQQQSQLAIDPDLVGEQPPSKCEHAETASSSSNSEVTIRLGGQIISGGEVSPELSARATLMEEAIKRFTSHIQENKQRDMTKVEEATQASSELAEASQDSSEDLFLAAAESPLETTVDTDKKDGHNKVELKEESSRSAGSSNTDLTKEKSDARKNYVAAEVQPDAGEEQGGERFSVSISWDEEDTSKSEDTADLSVSPSSESNTVVDLENRDNGPTTPTVLKEDTQALLKKRLGNTLRSAIENVSANQNLSRAKRMDVAMKSYMEEMSLVESIAGRPILMSDKSGDTTQEQDENVTETLSGEQFFAENPLLTEDVSKKGETQVVAQKGPEADNIAVTETNTESETKAMFQVEGNTTSGKANLGEERSVSKEDKMGQAMRSYMEEMSQLESIAGRPTLTFSEKLGDLKEIQAQDGNATEALSGQKALEDKGGNLQVTEAVAKEDDGAKVVDQEEPEVDSIHVAEPNSESNTRTAFQVEANTFDKESLEKKSNSSREEMMDQAMRNYMEAMTVEGIGGVRTLAPQEKLDAKDHLAKDSRAQGRGGVSREDKMDQATRNDMAAINVEHFDERPVLVSAEKISGAMLQLEQEPENITLDETTTGRSVEEEDEILVIDEDLTKTDDEGPATQFIYSESLEKVTLEEQTKSITSAETSPELEKSGIEIEDATNAESMHELTKAKFSELAGEKLESPEHHEMENAAKSYDEIHCIDDEFPNMSGVEQQNSLPLQKLISGVPKSKEKSVTKIMASDHDKTPQSQQLRVRSLSEYISKSSKSIENQDADPAHVETITHDASKPDDETKVVEAANKALYAEVEQAMEDYKKAMAAWEQDSELREAMHSTLKNVETVDGNSQVSVDMEAEDEAKTKLYAEVDQAMEEYNKAIAAWEEDSQLRDAMHIVFNDQQVADSAKKEESSQPYERRIAQDKTNDPFWHNINEPTMIMMDLEGKEGAGDGSINSSNNPFLVLSNDADSVENVLQNKPDLSNDLLKATGSRSTVGAKAQGNQVLEQELNNRNNAEETPDRPQPAHRPNKKEYAGRSVTEKILKKTEIRKGYTAWTAFQKLEKEWSELKASKSFDYDTKWLRKVQNGIPPPFQFVTEDASWSRPHCWEKLRSQRDKKLDFDVTIAGGEMGIFFAMVLQLKGFSVCVVEGVELANDDEEWQISMDELQELKRLGILEQEDIDASVRAFLPGCRAGMKDANDVPNKDGYEFEPIGAKTVGVSPVVLLERVASRFKDLGGKIFEQSPLMGIAISEYTGVAVDLGEDKEPLTASLVIDCLGSKSPMARQERYGLKPDGVCAVIGSCAAGFDKESSKQRDNLFEKGKRKNGRQQCFWESFPVVDGIAKKGLFGPLPGHANQKSPGSDDKTTYLYTYIADEERPSLESLMDDYWRMLSEHQPNVKDPVEDLDIKRVLFAYFPTYKDSLKFSWSRMLPVDIPYSMKHGGFGSVARNIGRICNSVSEALESQCLHKDDLAEINSYMPSQNVAWMMQKAMAASMGDSKFASRLLASMTNSGPQAINPFLKDTAQFGTLLETFANDPAVVPQVIAKVGLPSVIKHISMMGVYGVLDSMVAPRMEGQLKKLDPRDQFRWRRRMEAWRVGSGNDNNTENARIRKTSHERTNTEDEKNGD